MPGKPDTDRPLLTDADNDARDPGQRSDFDHQGPLTRTRSEKGPVRRSFRVPADPDEMPRVEIGGVSYRVHDVSEGGICHLLSKATTFKVGDDPGPIKVSISGEEIELSGVVAHVTPHGDNRVRCGIMFAALDPEALNTIRRYVEETRTLLFRE